MSANIKASTDGTQAIIGVGGVDQMTVSNAGVVTANSFAGALNSSSVTATGSTTARTLANRFADVVNVKDFGAVGDGVTDDRTAILAAFANPDGKPVFFPKGDYNSSTIPWQTSGAISFSEGLSKNAWLITRKMTGDILNGSGPLNGFSPTAYMQDLEEDCNVVQNQFMIASRVRHRFLGGPNTKGGRTAFISQFEKLGPTSSLNTNRNYVSSAAFITIASDDGGTNVTSNATAKGGHFAASWAVYLKPEGKNLLDVKCGELNLFGEAGASTRYQSGLTISCAYEQRGYASDAALSISGASSAPSINHVGYGAGILFSSTNGRQPFASDSIIILAKAGPNNPSGITPTVFRGIDFSEYNITDAILKGSQFQVKETSMTLGIAQSGFSLVDMNGTPTNGAFIFRYKGNGALQVQNDSNDPKMIVENNSIRNYTDTYSILHGTAAIVWRAGLGSPVGVVSAPVGSIYSRIDGGAGTTLYVKESGTGNTGWVAK